MKSKIEVSIDSNLVKLALFIAPILYLLFFYLLRYGDRKLYLFLTYEDHFLEIVSAITYLFATVIAFWVVKHYFSRKATLDWFVMGLFFIAMLFITGEEISWGQRIFGIETPEILLKNNVQKEISLHNIKPVQDILHRIYMLIGVSGALLWTVFTTKATLFNRRFVPQWYLMFYFLPVAAFYFGYDYLGLTEEPFGLIGRDQEVFELLLSIGFFLFIFERLIKIRDSNNSARWMSVNLLQQDKR